MDRPRRSVLAALVIRLDGVAERPDLVFPDRGLHGVLLALDLLDGLKVEPFGGRLLDAGPEHLHVGRLDVGGGFGALLGGEDLSRLVRDDSGGRAVQEEVRGGGDDVGRGEPHGGGDEGVDQGVGHLVHLHGAHIGVVDLGGDAAGDGLGGALKALLQDLLGRLTGDVLQALPQVGGGRAGDPGHSALEDPRPGRGFGLALERLVDRLRDGLLGGVSHAREGLEEGVHLQGLGSRSDAAVDTGPLEGDLWVDAGTAHRVAVAEEVIVGRARLQLAALERGPRRGPEGEPGEHDGGEDVAAGGDRGSGAHRAPEGGGGPGQPGGGPGDPRGRTHHSAALGSGAHAFDEGREELVEALDELRGQPSARRLEVRGRELLLEVEDVLVQRVLLNVRPAVSLIPEGVGGFRDVVGNPGGVPGVLDGLGPIPGRERLVAPSLHHLVVLRKGLVEGDAREAREVPGPPEPVGHVGGVVGAVDGLLPLLGQAVRYVFGIGRPGAEGRHVVGAEAVLGALGVGDEVVSPEQGGGVGQGRVGVGLFLRGLGGFLRRRGRSVRVEHLLPLLLEEVEFALLVRGRRHRVHLFLPPFAD